MKKTKTPRPAKHSKKWYKKQCDKVFGLIVRFRGVCAETNATDGLQCAHIISRSYLRTRWDYDNALCLSVKRHMYYTHHPVEWERFVIIKIGKPKYNQLKRKAINYHSMKLSDYAELHGRLLLDWARCIGKR